MQTNQHATTSSTYIRVGGALLATGIVLVAANMRACITAVGPLIGDIQTDMSLPGTAAGMLTTLPLIAFAVLSLFVPRMAQRFGMEYTLFASLILLIGGIALRSAPSVASLFGGTIVLGAGIALINVLLPGLIKRDFPSQIGLITGLYSMSMNGFAAVASGISVPIAESLSFGWRNTLLIWAILAMVAVLVWLPQLRKQRRRSTPNVQIHEVSGSLWRSRLAWQVTFFMGLQSLAFYVTVAWMPEILHDRGMNMEAAGWMLSLMQFVSIPSSFIIPVLAGKRSSQRSLVIITALCSIIGYGGLAAGGNTLLLLWIFLIGIGGGASISLALSFMGLRTKNAAQAAKLSGMAQSVGYLLAAVGPTLFGFLHDLTHVWTIPLCILVVSSFIFLLVGLGAGRNAYVD